MISPVIDSHQHVWDLERAHYDWLGPDFGPIDRTVTFDELAPSLVRTGVHATVLVESADNIEDTQVMFDTAARHRTVAAIVAYVPLDDPDEVARQLSQLTSSSLTVGVRNLIHNRADPDWLLRPEVDAGLALVEEAGLALDVVSVLPRHLELIPILSERHPRLRMVIDHLSKPPIGLEPDHPWWGLLADAAKNPSVHAKVSGLYGATPNEGSWTVDQVRPYFAHALQLFGPKRLMYGSDWPISITAGGYDRVWDGLNSLFSDLDAADRDEIMGATCARFYQIDPDRIRVAVDTSLSAHR
ncbi:amidohydrolase family protein [Microbacterium sp. Be9]|nr:amidohydrolase family protein [Microbacterium sp. Be9]